jgi:hypothetical protein
MQEQLPGMREYEIRLPRIFDLIYGVTVLAPAEEKTLFRGDHYWGSNDYE